LSSASNLKSTVAAAAATSFHNSAAATVATTTTVVPLNQQRSKSALQTLIQRRVRERENWTVHGAVESAVPPPRVVAKFLVRSLPLYFLFRPPSQVTLDRELPVLRPMDWNLLKEPPAHDEQIRLTWLGHASVLVQFPGGVNLLTDPVFSDRCSPSQWFGPKRYRPPPCSVRELCQHLEIHAVLISHNHYDHLDYGTVQALAQASPQTIFVVPLGLQAWFRKHIVRHVVNVKQQNDVDSLNIYELDWHESTEPIYAASSSTTSRNSAVHVTAVPVRHWSNRSGGDRDRTLWCGYAVVQSIVNNNSENNNNNNAVPTTTTKKSFLFPGDTAWFDEMHQLIGERYGPFDVAALPIGAYEPRDFMKHAHLNVSEAVAMQRAVRARHAVPIHWGTFPLTVEPVLEPRQRLLELVQQQQQQNQNNNDNNRNDGDDSVPTGSFAPWLIGETKVF